MQKFGYLALWYCVAYITVTAVGILHTVFNIYVLHMKSMKESDGMGEAYEKTKPWHPLYNIIVFPFFGFLYLRGIDGVGILDALYTSLIWGTTTVIFDLFGWVLIKHPWSLTFKGFYVDYQPWITLIYLAIFASPFIAYGILSL